MLPLCAEAMIRLTRHIHCLLPTDQYVDFDSMVGGRALSQRQTCLSQDTSTVFCQRTSTWIFTAWRTGAQDCEFTYLSTQILHLLGREGPRTKEPARYIRYIYNRIILENATVRAAAVASLARFGAVVAELRPRILVLLSRALYDNDDEARGAAR